jgi:hypothetical protein
MKEEKIESKRRCRRLTIAMATRGNDLYIGTVSFLLNELSVGNTGFFVAVGDSASGNQEACFKAMVREGADWNFICDADVGLSVGLIGRLMRHDKDMVVSPVVMYLRHQPGSIHYNACGDDKLETRTFLRGRGLQRIVTSSFASLLIKMRVLEEFIKRGESFVKWSSLLGEEMKIQNSDSIFFLKAAKMGFELWMDWEEADSVHSRIIDLTPNLMESHIYYVDKQRGIEGEGTRI